MSEIAKNFRWRIANLMDKLPGQCWADLVTWSLGRSRNPWSPIGSTCRSDAARCGACYCGKLRREGGEQSTVLPIHTGPGYCLTCSAQPGDPHYLSCPEVSLEQCRAYLGGAR